MWGKNLCCFLLALAALGSAADPAWRSKLIAQWTKEDAKQVTANSPWAKRTVMAILPQRSESQLREGGRMGGGGERAGLAKVDTTQRATLAVRWESAAPLRAAEMLAGETSAPDWDGDYYAIAVYDVPGITPGADKILRGELRQTTFLKRDGKKDIKPARVEIALLGGNYARILYLFSRDAVLREDDGPIEFVSQIGRIYVGVVFGAADMMYQGKLQL
jgi:hypothetical protein